MEAYDNCYIQKMLEALVVLINMIHILFSRVFLIEGKYFYKLTNTLAAG
jgi:hypothetical protein